MIMSGTIQKNYQIWCQKEKRKLEKFWIYQSKSFQNRSKGYLLTILWTILVFNKK